MISFVLSGGGSLGAIQAGMLEALLDAGIVPDALVGTSIGAANAAYIAAEPTPERARGLSDLWRSVKGRDMFPIKPLKSLRSLTGTGALFDPAPFRALIRDHLPYRSIENAAVPLRIVATDFADGNEAIFEKGPVDDAVLASTALPGIFPPHLVQGRLYLDGGLVDHVPIAPAIALGADTIYVLSCGFPCPPRADHRSARSVIAHSVGILLSQRIRVDVRSIRDQRPDLTIVSIPPICTHAGIRDLGRTASLISEARDQTSRFLAGEPCHQCRHGHETPEITAPVEEVMRLHSDVEVA